MPNKPTTQPQLLAENEDLRARLDKAEVTLNEILSGEADALFVTGAGGAQLFTLKGADQSYRTLIENMSEGALTLTPEGLILYANRRFAEMLITPLEKVIGSDIYTWFEPDSRRVLQFLLRNDAAGNHREELALAAADGTQVPVYLSVSRLLQDGMHDSICMVATDLTEQKRNEAILAAEKLSNAILEQAADAIVICDETGRIMRASKQAQALYGNNCIGQLFEQAFPLRQPDGAAFSAVSAIDTKHSLSVEARLERSGQGFDLLVSVGHLMGVRNELLGSVVTLTDITERKGAEEEIKFKNTILQTQQETSPDAILVVDENSHIFSFNQQFAHLWRIPPQILSAGVDAPVLQAVADQVENADAFVAQVQYLYAHHGEKSHQEVQLKDGRIIDRHSAPMIGTGGKYYGRVWYFRDITERKHAELELRESERRFSDLLGNVELVSMMLDREARITYCNEYLLRLTGWRLEDVIGQNWFDLFVPPELNMLKDGFFTALLDNQFEALHHENEILTRSGLRRFIRWSNSVLRSADGRVIGTASIGEDITERNQLELEKEQYFKFWLF